MRKPQLIVALDVETFEEARRLIDQLADTVDVFKIGSQLFTSCGPVAVRYLLAMGKKVFLDLKFHDIPNTVGNAVRAAVSINSQGVNGILMYTVHTLGGRAMLEAAVAAAQEKSKELGIPKPLTLGITVLTSDAPQANIAPLVLEWARLAKESGLDGVVASVEESPLIRREFGKDFVIVTPGIRPQGADKGDQARVATPAQAILNGSDYLVVGRPIVKAENQRAAALAILEEIQIALKNGDTR